MKRDRYVYGIPYEPEHPAFGGSPCYIGMGKGHRMHDHLRAARNGHESLKSLFLRDCLTRGITPTPYVIASNMTLDEAKAVEVALIAHYGRVDRRTGSLLNLNSGGNGNDLSEASRNRMSAMRKGRPMPPSFSIKLSARNRIQKRGKPQSPDHVAKRIAPQFGSQRSENTRAKIGRAHKGRPKPAEMRAKLSAAHLGKKASEETKAKMRASSPKTRGPYSEARKAAISAAKQNIPAEVRANMKAAAQAREARKREAKIIAAEQTIATA